MPVHINKSKLQDKKQQGILFSFWEKVFSAYFDITKNKMLFKEKRFHIVFMIFFIINDLVYSNNAPPNIPTPTNKPTTANPTASESKTDSPDNNVKQFKLTEPWVDKSSGIEQIPVNKDGRAILIKSILLRNSVIQTLECDDLYLPVLYKADEDQMFSQLPIYIEGGYKKEVKVHFKQKKDINGCRNVRR